MVKLYCLHSIFSLSSEVCVLLFRYDQILLIETGSDYLMQIGYFFPPLPPEIFFKFVHSNYAKKTNFSVFK
jgi:hypothetical protein